MLTLRFFILVVLFVGSVWGHGYMTDPPARNGANDFAVNNLPCGGNQYNTPGNVVKTYTGNMNFESHNEKQREGNILSIVPIPIY
jgi:hypothetical protein